MIGPFHPILAAGGWFDWLFAVPPVWWWALLAVTLASAGVNLFSLFSTRWGDRGERPKSLLFSLLAHAALLFGVFALLPDFERMLGEPGESPAEPERRFQIGEVRLDAADDPAPDRDPLPWRDPNAPSERVPERSELDPADPVETPAVARTRPDLADDPAPLATADRAVREDPFAAPDAAELAVAEPAVADAPAPETSAAEETPAPDEPAVARSELPDIAPAETPNLRRTRPSLPADAATVLTERRPARDADPAAPAPSVSTPEVGPVASAAPPVDVPVPEGPQPVDAPPPPRRTALPDAPAIADSGLPRRTRLPDDAPVVGGGLTERRGRTGEDRDPGPEAVVSSAPDLAPPAPGVPDAYRLRDLTRRSEVARALGGTAQSEAAVERALAWFARQQEPDGRWDGSRHAAGRGTADQTAEDEPDPNKRQTGRRSDTGLTGLVTLSFLGAGYTRTAGRYAPVVDKAVRYLVAQQRRDGDLGGRANYYARMYCHGIAAYALAEALALEGDDADPALRRAVEDAVAYTASQQYPDGGWRYSQRAEVRVGDMSMFGWQCLALKSADNAGVPMPPRAREGMIRFLKARSETRTASGRVVQQEFGGLARYIPKEGEEVKPSMTAEALFCKQVLGVRRDNPASLEAVAYMGEHPPELRQWNLYYWYYATLALYQHGGPAWDRWNDELRELLLAEQFSRGPDAGAWPVRSNGANFTAYGGRLYSTAMATLCLEVYYRFTPALGGAAAMDGRGG